MIVPGLESHNCSLCTESSGNEKTIHQKNAEAYNNLFAEYTKLQQASWTATVHRKLSGKPFQFFHPVIEKIVSLAQALLTKQSRAIQEKTKPLKEIETGFQNDRKEYTNKVRTFLRIKCSDSLYGKQADAINAFSQKWWKENLFESNSNYSTPSDSDDDTGCAEVLCCCCCFPCYVPITVGWAFVKDVFETLRESFASCLEKKQKPIIELKKMTNQDLTQFDAELADLFAQILPRGEKLKVSLSEQSSEQSGEQKTSKSKKIKEKFKKGVSSFLSTSSNSTKNSSIGKKDPETERDESLQNLSEIKDINVGLYVKASAAWIKFHNISLGELPFSTNEHLKISEEVKRLSQTPQEQK